MSETFDEMVLWIFKDVYGNASSRNYDPVAAIHVEFARRLCAELLRDARYNPWKSAVIDELVICGTYSNEHDADPQKAIKDAISWNVQIALDPQVSSDAQALIDHWREETKKELLREDEPVAWHDPSNTDPGQSVRFGRKDHEKWPHIYNTPLYLHPAPKVPEDYVLVPKEPTEVMIDAANNAGASTYTGTWTIDPAECWIVMLAAAQKENG